MLFASKRELKRYCELEFLEQACLISGLQRQVYFEVAPAVMINGKKRAPIRYICDFTYFDKESNEQVIEDVKGVLTAVYIIKRHLMALKGLKIVEIK